MSNVVAMPNIYRSPHNRLEHSWGAFEDADLGSRDLSDRVLVALTKWRIAGSVKPGGLKRWYNPEGRYTGITRPNPTMSVDDGAKHIPENYDATVGFNRDGTGAAYLEYFTWIGQRPHVLRTEQVDAATPALALTIAILEAKQAKE